jgi:hypothetical protein
LGSSGSGYELWPECCGGENEKFKKKKKVEEFTNQLGNCILKKPIYLSGIPSMFIY